MKRYTIQTILIFILVNPSFSQKVETWLNIKINGDTCSNRNCDTLIYTLVYDFEHCLLRGDTLLNTNKKKRFTPLHIQDNLVVVKTLNPPIEVNFEAFFTCSRTLIDSSNKMKKYKIIESDNSIYYEEEYQDRKQLILKTYDEKHTLLSSDSSLLNIRNKRKVSYFKSYSKYASGFSKTRFYYHLNGRLKKTERVSKSDKVKYISKFSSKGILKQSQYFQWEPRSLDDTKFEWQLFNQSTFFSVNAELAIEAYENYFNESTSKIYTYSGENYHKTIEKNGCFIKTEISMKL